jgi:predicted PurR-regulated permease PerM
MTSPAEHNRIIARAVVMAVVGFAAVYTLYQIRTVLLMVYISGLLAIGFSPAVHWIEQRRRIGTRRFKLPRWFAILVLYAGGLTLVAIVMSFVIPPFMRQMNQLWENLPGYLDRLQGALVRVGLIQRQWSWGELLANVQVPGSALGGILGALPGVIGAFGRIVTLLLLPFYLLLEADALRRGFLRFVSPENRPRASRIMENVTLKVGAWLGGQLVLSFVIGTTAAIGLWILGVPYFYVLGLIAGLGELIPVIGPILATIPAVLVGLTVSPQTGLLVLIYFAVQQLIENNVLVPRIMEKQVGVSAVTILIALMIGSQLQGFVGAILAVPTAAIVQVLIQEYLDREDADG